LDAVPLFQKILQANPSNLKAQANLAAALYALHRYADAASAFSRASELSPQDPYLLTNLGTALQKAGKEQEAKQAFAKAFALRNAPKPAAAAGTN
jgi:Flp pilus assembly protein TadD